MDKAELKRVLDAHYKWLYGEDGGTRADLTDAVLSDADLTDAVLSGADLTDADLTDADLIRADLTGADLTGADLTGADLTGAHLIRAVLTDAIINYPISCPSEGAFVAFKKARNMDEDTFCIVKLMICDDAKRFSATSRKCRCDKARVLEIYDMRGNTISANVCSMWDRTFRYVIGETVAVPNFDDCRWNECSTGIHFFITREEAERYNG